MTETMEERVTRLLLDYARIVPAERPFPASLSIRKDLEVESLALVSVAIRLGDELNADVIDAGVELGSLDTVGDLVAIGRRLVPQVAMGA
jgi:acyl carrier protein